MMPYFFLTEAAMRNPLASLATFTEPARRVPVVHDCDVCVLGGSATGVFAAIRAARLGARVALVERQNAFGGVATAGFVHIWHSLYDTEHATQIIGGLTAETLERLRRRGAAMSGGRYLEHDTLLNTEELKIELDALVLEHGITPFLHTLYVAPVLDGDRVAGVIVENKDGRQAIRARVFIDATGDGDLARDCGLDAVSHGPLQPPTMCAKLQGLDTLGDFDWQTALRVHGAEFGLEPDWGWGAPIPGLPDIQMRADTHVFGIDAAQAGDLTRGELAGRRKIRAILDLLRAYGPPDAAVALAGLPATLGIRETRRIAATYRLTGDDVLTGRRFPDAIANGSYPVDIHHADGPGITFRYLDGHETVIAERGLPAVMGRWRPETPTNPTFYGVPLGCLVPPRIANLLLAGRMLDVDTVAFSAVRVMVNLNQTGEAAGVAAWHALQADRPVQAVDPARVRATLAEGGSIIR
jgi:glycine/D-amino acid oxidase-like deaminating enzyme